MQSPTDGSPVRFPLLPAATWSLAPALLAAAASAATSAALTGTPRHALVAAACVLIGAMSSWGLLVLASMSPRAPGAWSLVVVYAQAARMFAAVMLGVLVTVLASPPAMLFWMSFLAVSLAYLVGEVAWLVRFMRGPTPRIVHA